MRVVGTFLEYNGKFVILLRHSHKPNGGTWGLPAGKVEANESDTTAALRELREETGYDADESQLEYLREDMYQFNDDAPFVFAAFRVKIDHPHDVRIESAAHAEFRWVSGQECYDIPNLVPGLHVVLKRIGYAQ